MAFDAFIWFDGIPGESVDPAHTSWIEITAFNLAATQGVSKTAGQAYGASVERFYLSDFSIVEPVDTNFSKNPSSMLRGFAPEQGCAQRIPLGGERQRCLEVIFDDVLVSGLDSGTTFSATRVLAA